MRKSVAEELQEMCLKIAQYEEYTIEIGITISAVLHEPPTVEYGALYMEGDSDLFIRLDDITEVREHPRDEYDLKDEWRVTLLSERLGRIDIDAYGAREKP